MIGFLCLCGLGIVFARAGFFGLAAWHIMAVLVAIVIGCEELSTDRGLTGSRLGAYAASWLVVCLVGYLAGRFFRWRLSRNNHDVK